MLRVGDVVRIHEYGYGLLEDDVGKFVEIVDIKRSAYHSQLGYQIKPYDSILKTKNPGDDGFIGVETFIGEEDNQVNPFILLNTKDVVHMQQGTAKQIKSDGGSSEYYQKEIVRLEDGEKFECKTGDIIRCLVNNDFDGGNILKAVDRIFQSVQGKGKEGTSIEYDCNKIIYFANIIKKRFEGM